MWTLVATNEQVRTSVWCPGIEGGVLFLVANLGGKSQEPLLELRFPLDDKAVNASVVVTETEGLMNQEVMVGLIVLLAVGFILAKLPKT